MRRQVIISVILVAALLAGGGAVATYLVRTKAHPPTNPTQRPALLVRGLKLVPQTVVEPIFGYGTAHADRHAQIAAQVPGELVQLSPKLRVGQLVEHGELLIRIDDRDYQRRLDRAQSLLAAEQAQLARLDVEQQNTDRLITIAATELEIAQREYQRVLDLFESNRAANRELDQARQGFEQARRELQTLENQKALFPQQRAVLSANRDLRQAELELAQLDLERCRINAPFRGHLDAVHVEIGERVNVGSPLFAILDPDLIEVPIEFPISLRDRVADGAKCELSLESNPTAAWSGHLARIAPAAQQATRTFSLFVEVDNTTQDHPLIPGMFVRARIDGPTWHDALVVPRGIIQQQHVFVYDHGLARRRAVKVDRHLFDQTVVAGLNPGDTVIISNLDALYDGAPVRIQPDPPTATASDASPIRTRSASERPANTP